MFLSCNVKMLSFSRPQLIWLLDRKVHSVFCLETLARYSCFCSLPSCLLPLRVDVSCVNLAKLELHFPEFCSVHQWLGSEEKFCLRFRRQKWGSHILFVLKGCYWHGVQMPFMSLQIWWLLWLVWAPPGPTRFPMSVSLALRPGALFSMGESHQLILRVTCLIDLEACR